MKRDAAYYEEQGRVYARAGAAASNTLPLGPENTNSWQSKAWERGYRAAMDAMHREQCNALVETQPAPLRVSNTGNAVREHIATLRNMAHDTTDLKRRARLFAKADKLDAKWFGAPEYPSTSHAA